MRARAAGFPFFYSFNTKFLPASRITGDIELLHDVRPNPPGQFMVPLYDPRHASLRYPWIYKRLKIKNNLFGDSLKPVFPVDDDYFRDLVPALGGTSVREFRSVIRSDDPKVPVIPIIKAYSEFPIPVGELTIDTQYPCYPIAAIKYGYGFLLFIGMHLVKHRPQDFELRARNQSR